MPAGAAKQSSPRAWRGPARRHERDCWRRAADGSGAGRADRTMQAFSPTGMKCRGATKARRGQVVNDDALTALKT